MGPLSLIPLAGIPEVQEDADLAALVVSAADAGGTPLAEHDIVVISSKIVSKARGLWAGAAERSAAVEGQTVRVVAERMTGERLTRIVQSTSGPVMAAAGVDMSNTGGREDVLLLPLDPDAEAASLREELLEATGLDHLGVVLSDTAGRPWRSGQTDFALGAAGVVVVEDLRGGVDADGRALTVTARALADELAAAADLVKGKADAIPVAIVRGTSWALARRGSGAASLLRTGREDWFGYGRAEAVRAALGTEPGSEEAFAAGIPSVEPELRATRLARAAAVASTGVPGCRIEPGEDAVTLRAPTAYQLGLAAARLQVALWGEGLVALLPAESAGVELVLPVAER